MLKSGRTNERHTMQKKEYKGWNITSHQNGTYSIEVVHNYVDKSTAKHYIEAKTVKELEEQVDAWIAEQAKEDKQYQEELDAYAKEINETQTRIAESVKTVLERSKQALDDVIHAGEILTKARARVEKTLGYTP